MDSPGPRRRWCWRIINSVIIASALGYCVKLLGAANSSAGGACSRIFENCKLNDLEFVAEFTDVATGDIKLGLRLSR